MRKVLAGIVIGLAIPFGQERPVDLSESVLVVDEIHTSRVVLREESGKVRGVVGLYGDVPGAAGIILYGARDGRESVKLIDEPGGTSLSLYGENKKGEVHLDVSSTDARMWRDW
jgi:hypothetical protein